MAQRTRDGRTRDAFAARLTRIEAVVHNQDNREHDLLDSDDYYQFEGGLSAAIEALSGAAPRVYHNDHSRPETAGHPHARGGDCAASCARASSIRNGSPA